MNNQRKKHVVGVLLENEAGALSRVVGLFSQRGYNIESMTVAPTQDSTLSRLTLTTYAPPHIMEQIAKQLNKIVPVYKVVELSEDISYLEREVLLVKLRAQGEYRAEIKKARRYIRRQDRRCNRFQLYGGVNWPQQRTGCLYSQPG